MKEILKRDGRKVEFDINKIAGAIEKAFNATGTNKNYEYCLELANQVVDVLEGETCEIPSVEHIQDIVEKVLIDNGHVRTAKAYIIYRANRSRQREMNNNLMKIYEEITFSDARDSNIKRENANVDGNTAMGAMLKYGSEGSKHFYQLYMLKPEQAEAHKNGDIHIHDLDFYGLTTTCCQIDLIELFKNGFSTGHGVLREPQDIYSYSALACIAIQSNQNDQHGGQAVPNFDYALGKGVACTYKKRYRDAMYNIMDVLIGEDAAKKATEIYNQLAEEGVIPKLTDDGYLKKEAEQLKAAGLDEATVQNAQKHALKQAYEQTNKATYQAMEALIHNLNTMNSRAGAQTPFSSINYGMDTSPEGRMVMRNLMEATEAGLGHGETPIFPIQIFRVKEGVNFNPGDPNYDLFKLAIRCSAKRLFPNFSFVDAPFNLQYYKEGHPETEVAYMGCRTRVMGNVYDKDNEIAYRRGNLSFTSINLPRLAIKAKGDIDAFFRGLDQMMDLVVQQLLDRFEIQRHKRVYNYPFLMGQGVWLGSENLRWDEEVGEVLKHGTFSVGFIGLAEALVALIGEHHGQSEKAQNLGLDIVTYMRERMDAESQKRGLNFTLLATPAEGLSGRFVKIDRKKYGTIPGVTDRDYYTNSFHVPVYYPISAFKKIEIEAPYHALTNAGHISYIEMDGDPTKNLDAFEKVIRYMKECGIGYGSVNHPVDRDPVCGYNGIIDDECPVCHRHEGDGNQNFQRIRRITGYLVGTLDKFNDGKRAEEKDRVKHTTSVEI